MNLNAIKRSISSLRRSFEGSLHQTALASPNNQRDLGVQMNNNLTWSLNCNTRLNKAWRFFYFLKRSTAKIAGWKTKLNTYTGYIVYVVDYASHVWFAKKGDMNALERLQRKSKLWIMNYPSNKTYKERFEHLKLLPLSFNLELHELLFFLGILPTNTTKTFLNIYEVL